MSRTPTILLILILIITFPIWIALAAVLFGLIIGLFGGIIGLFGGIVGLIGGLFGGIMGLIGGIFDVIFNSHSWEFGWHPNFHFNGYVFFALIIIVALIINKRQKR